MTSTLNPAGRQFLNVLTTGHGKDRLPADSAALFKQVDAILTTVRDFATSRYGAQTLRLLTGNVDGTDQWVNQWGQNKDQVVLIPVVPESPPQSDEKVFLIAVDKCKAVPNTGRHTSSYSLHAETADDFKRFMSDLVIAVWDGQPGRDMHSGTVSNIVNAMQQRKPVIWIDAKTADCAFFDPFAQTDTTLEVLDPRDPAPILELFSKLSLDQLSEKLETIFKQMAEAAYQDKKILPLVMTRKPLPLEKQSQQCNGLLYNLFMVMLSAAPLKKLCSRLSAWRGPKSFVQSSCLDEQYWATFDRFDKLATYTAGKFRSNVVGIHLLSALAVFAAVSGAISLFHMEGAVWTLLELGALLIALVLIHKEKENTNQNTKSLWMHARQGAELMRMLALLYPYLATLPEINRQVWRRSFNPQKKVQLHLIRPAQWLALQKLRDAELPCHAAPSYILVEEIPRLKTVLSAFIDDQLHYHKKNRITMEKTHHRIHWWVKTIFFVALATVLLHLYEVVVEHFFTAHHEDTWWVHLAELIKEQEWLLLLTAFAPALAAAMHGIGGMLEFKRTADNSAWIIAQLSEAKSTLKEIGEDHLALRALAKNIATDAYREHENWSKIVSTNDLDIPA